ncbi:hypothetical protein IGI04_014677 [Brassica rapa subsp. trilocularis]|uniref:Uncharacterized protein n=1 Tax=Brassica rapa subsp. trilocularis TaxID=1813537 RepID=A0ABQ7MNJ6_BRACM|nr:hypothetical protein IGI04_014677 [Brassica rapa subsp. trilocularis]
MKTLRRVNRVFEVANKKKDASSLGVVSYDLSLTTAAPRRRALSSTPATTSTVINSGDDEHCHHLRRKHEALIVFSPVSLSQRRHQGDEIPINSGDDKHYHQLRRNHEALILQHHLVVIPKSRVLRFKYEASIFNDNGLRTNKSCDYLSTSCHQSAALTVLSLAFLRNVAYDIVNFLLLVLVKLSSIQNNFRKHLYSFSKAFQNIGWLLNLLMSLLLLVLVKLSSVQKKKRKHLCSFRKAFQKLGWKHLCSFRKAFQNIGCYFSLFTQDRNKMGDSDFGWTRLDKENDTHVNTKEK